MHVTVLPLSLLLPLLHLHLLLPLLQPLLLPLMHLHLLLLLLVAIRRKSGVSGAGIIPGNLQ
jgi:hypothetical protein